MKKPITLLMVLAGFAATTVQAQSLFDWSFTTTPGGTVDGSGTMVVDTSPTDYSMNGGYLVESMSGTYLGQTISGLISAGIYPIGLSGNDNLLQNVTGIPEQLDFSGVAFDYGSSGVEDFRFAESGDVEDQNGNAGIFSATPDLTPVPESSVNPELMAAAGLFIGWRSWRSCQRLKTETLKS